MFVDRLRQMARYPQRLLVIAGALSQMKSPHAHRGADPNKITQSLIASLAGSGIPFLCVETHELGGGDRRLLPVPGLSLSLAGGT